MAFSPLKITLFQLQITPFKAQNCRYKFSFLRADIFVFRNHQSPITHCQNHNVEKLHVFSCGICLPLEAKCDLLEAKNVLKSNFNISFRAQLCDIGNVSSFASRQNNCSTPQVNMIYDFKMQTIGKFFS